MRNVSKKYVFVGGGRASAFAVQALIEAGVSGSDILLIAYEPEYPYDRPPLSKGYLAGNDTRDSLFINPEADYAQHGIEHWLGDKVTELHPKERRLVTERGEQVLFDQLLLATGAKPRQLVFPGSDLKPIVYLRTIVDSDYLKEMAARSHNAVIVGGGFIGLEVAASLRQLGLNVTIIHREDRLLNRFAVRELSDFFTQYFIDQGVSIRFERALDHFEGETGSVNRVVTDHGDEIPADLVVIGVGAELNLGYLPQTGEIRTSDGILVDEELETAVPGIFAAGDIANFPDVLFDGKRRRIEHWDHAEATGKAVAANMLGKHQPFRHLSYFFSDMFDLSFEVWGDTDHPDQVIYDGNLGRKTAAAWYVRGGKLVAYFALNRPEDEKQRAQDDIISQRPFDASAPR